MKEDLLSIVVPLFNEEENIPVLYQEIKQVMAESNYAYELILVNDGSTDGSLERMRESALKDSALKVISLSRNFGQTAALVSGIDYASGEIVVLMDGDLQNDPGDIPSLIQKINQGYDVASGWRKKRKDAFWTKVLPSLLANKSISFFSGVHLHDYGCTLKAYRTKILKDIRLYGEMHRFIPIYASWIGAKITEIPVNHRPRTRGKSKYTPGKSLKVILDLVIIKFIGSYRTKPIYVFGGSGIVSMFLSFICVGILIYNKLIHGISMIQSPFLILSALLVMVGVQCILMGILAEMQIRTYFESSRRRIYYIKETINI